MSVYEKIIQILKNSNIEYQALEHEPTKTCADAARIRGTSADQGAKALVCVADKRPILIVLPCSKRLDPKAFKRRFAIRDLRFATPLEVTQITSLEIGSIPPFGSLFKLTTYLDSSLSTQNKIAFNAGDVCKSIIMKYSDFVDIEKPQIGVYS